MDQRLVKFPLKFFITFWIITILMYFLSPWKWPKENTAILLIFNFFACLFFFFGYKKGIKKFKSKSSETSKPQKLQKILSWSIVLNLIFIYPKFLFRLQIASASISYIYSRIVMGIVLPSEAYLEKHESSYEGFLTLSNPLVLLYNLILPLLYIAVPVGILYWKRITAFQKNAILLIILLDILSYIAIGTNKGIFDYILVLPWLFVINYPSILNFSNFSQKKILVVSFSIIVLLIGLNYLTKGISGRKKKLFFYESSTNTHLNQSAVILKLIPDGFENQYITLDNYLTQGYYVLDKALVMKWKPCFGAGHSFFLTSIYEKVLGKNYISNRTYQSRLEDKYGYSHYGKWHTFYTWMANDLSFIGVILLMYFIGYYFSLSWLEALYDKNILAVSVFTLFTIMLFYISANNQVLGFQGSSITFWVLFLIWRLKKIKFK